MTTELTKGALRSLSMESVLPFGKYKGTTVEGVIKGDPAYLVWMRDAKKDQPDFFAYEIHRQLDLTIVQSKSLTKKYKLWNVVPTPGQIPQTAAATIEAAATASAVSYQNTWGAW